MYHIYCISTMFVQQPLVFNNSVITLCKILIIIIFENFFENDIIILFKGTANTVGAVTTDGGEQQAENKDEGM